VIDREYIIFRYIPSLPLNDPAVPVGARPGLYQQVGQIIARIHAIQGDQFGWLRPDSRQELFDTWGGFLKRYAREIADRAADHGALSEAELAAFLQVFQDPTAFNQITQARMVHTDLWDGNVLVRERNGEWEVAAIIDVDRSIFGDPVMDFAAPWSENGDFLQGYGSWPPDSAAARFRSAAYTLMGSFMYAYVWLAQYDDPERYAKAKQRGLQALEVLANS
jgi:aminoglycoside phosphotransferase (APT) family kinase protein